LTVCEKTKRGSRGPSPWETFLEIFLKFFRKKCSEKKFQLGKNSGENIPAPNRRVPCRNPLWRDVIGRTGRAD